MLIDEIRLANLVLLTAEQNKSVTELARDMRMEPTYLINIKNRVRKMGHKKARQIEKALHLPKGAMDNPNLGRKRSDEYEQPVSRETLLSDLQVVYRVNRRRAEKAVALLDVEFEAERPARK